MSQTVAGWRRKPKGISARNPAVYRAEDAGGREQVEGSWLLEGEWIAQGKVEVGVIISMYKDEGLDWTGTHENGENLW